jgi:hypothetical protein
MSARKKSTARPRAPFVREGESLVHVFNSGLEAWLYDEGNRERIVATGAMDLEDLQALTPLFRDGWLVAYGLYQDDALEVAVIVGPPLTDAELAVARWLEPQHAFLSCPTGALCIESNDAARILPEGGDEAGGRVTVPPGDYRITLHRVDHEALDRARMTWKGPQEVLVLTPGGTPADAATEILPFEQRRDLSWVGQVTVAGTRADALAWFDDALDTAVLNLEATHLERLGARDGACLLVRVPQGKVAFTVALAPDWKTGATLVPPAGVDVTEWGFASVQRMGDWGVPALFVRRERAARAIPRTQQHAWLPCTVERLAVEAAPPARVRGEVVLDAGARVYWRGHLADRLYYGDAEFLTAKLFSRVDGVGFGEATDVARAIALVDEAFGRAGLAPAGDLQFDVTYPQQKVEYTNRLYLGLEEAFGVVWGSKNVFECLWYSELDDGAWVLTGTIPEAVARQVSRPPRLHVRHFPLRIHAALEKHRAHVAEVGRPVRPAPADFATAVAAYERYLAVALG